MYSNIVLRLPAQPKLDGAFLKFEQAKRGEDHQTQVLRQSSGVDVWAGSQHDNSRGSRQWPLLLRSWPLLHLRPDGHYLRGSGYWESRQDHRQQPGIGAGDTPTDQGCPQTRRTETHRWLESPRGRSYRRDGQ